MQLLHTYLLYLGFNILLSQDILNSHHETEGRHLTASHMVARTLMGGPVVSNDPGEEGPMAPERCQSSNSANQPIQEAVASKTAQSIQSCLLFTLFSCMQSCRLAAAIAHCTEIAPSNCSKAILTGVSLFVVQRVGIVTRDLPLVASLGKRRLWPIAQPCWGPDLVFANRHT